MARSSISVARPVMPRGRAIRILIAAVAVAGSAAAIASWRLSLSPSTASRRVVRPPLRVDSPYANARPGVGYVGDEVCARCHAAIAATYRDHPMGRSLAPIGAAGIPGLDEAADGRPLFEAGGLEYSAERRDGKVFHRETRRDPSGRVVARNEAEVRFVLGSGNQGASFLVDRDGFLFQSPISWYARRRRWDLSPGYRRSNAHFDRGVIATCLYCHANRVEPVEGSVNRYEPPIFRGHAIGCERCHGPGALHARRPDGGGGDGASGPDLTIVNPSALESSLRDAVCEQCHLMGRQRVLKLDRREDDYRPGLPFYLVWSVFEPAGGPDMEKFVGHVEQMHESECFRAGGGRLGCISCHDPHRRPEPAGRAAFYRGRCLQCHGESRGCRLPEPSRRARSREDDCTACHMPKLGESDIAHVAATDHRIPRRPASAAAGATAGATAATDPSPGETGSGPAGAAALVLFHRELMDDRGRAEAQRDLAVALCREGPAAAVAALPMLARALADRPDDRIARQAEGVALGRLGRFADGLAAFRAILAREPDDEPARVGAAEFAGRLGRRAEAIADWRLAIAQNPWRAGYRTGLAAQCFRERDWPGAIDAARAAIRLNPADLEARRVLVPALLHVGDEAAARDAFRTLLDLAPPDRAELLRRFSRIAPPRAGPPGALR